MATDIFSLSRLQVGLGAAISDVPIKVLGAPCWWISAHGQAPFERQPLAAYGGK